MTTETSPASPPVSTPAPATSGPGPFDSFKWFGRLLGQGFSHLKMGGGSFFSRQVSLSVALLLALVAGFIGGEATKLNLPSLNWHWPWHWPTPTPGPTPPGPTPTPTPAPIPAKGLHVLIVVDNANISKMPSKQVAALTAADVRSYLNATCPKGPDGQTPEYRIWDIHTDASLESKLWQDALKRAAGKTPPWLIVSNGQTGFEGPLPADTDSLLALLKKVGG